MAKPLLSFYGDDFTGSSAVMEVLSFAGITTVMFLEPPSADTLARYPDIQAMGIAGVARSRNPQWMDENLPAAFEALAQFGAPLAHYKTCSTFDSSPSTGSVGKAIEIGEGILGGQWLPMVIGAPAIQRYQAFGQLFAGMSNGVHRLDRHPIMRSHPATPMDEADVRLHLARQTSLNIDLIDLAQIKSGCADRVLAEKLAQGAKVVAIDVLDDETLTEAGRLLWGNGKGPVFAIGSQGVEYALVAHWRKTGFIAPDYCPSTLRPVEQLFCVSGSCSGINTAQIQAAEEQGFLIIDIDATQAIEERAWGRELELVTAKALKALSSGQDVIVATERGLSDQSAGRLNDAINIADVSRSEVNDRIGTGLGQLVSDIRIQTQLARVAVAGGDTSGHAMTALGVKALEAVAPLAPGAPLCRVTSDSQAIDGLEVTLKGGQMGSKDFFNHAKTGIA